MDRFTEGQKVRFNGRTNIINDEKYAGQVGTVYFQQREVLGVPGLVYVHIKAPGQRTNRCIALHQEALEVVA
jgi:hypothetical protein